MIFLNASVFLLDRYASFWSYVYSDLDNTRKLYIYIGSRTFIDISDPAYFYYNIRYSLRIYDIVYKTTATI